MFDQLIQKMYKRFSNDIGIDLGTANTLVYVRGHGIVIDEPSIVAMNKKTKRIVAVGAEAKRMLGRTPGHIEAIRPLVDGVISDFEITEEMLSYLINKAEKVSPKLLRPRVVVGVPSGITNVETRAVYDAAKSAGAREIYIIEEPMAAAIGIRLPVHDPVGSMVIDIGGGTTDIAVVSLGGIVQSKNLKVAGDRISNDIMQYIRNEFKILIGDKTAEYIKTEIGSARAVPGEILELEIKGRDLVSGLPREILLTDADIREAIGDSIRALVDAAKEVVETTPPEILSDIVRRGIFLTGGGALIRGLDVLLHEELNIPVHVANDPLSAVARGAGIILENVDMYRDVLVQENDHVLPR
ncbi:MAG: rod shape-determining protein [Candidatus Pacebacteria bacterium]|nr:rod shape-determining protein [Candidatus Paceibacterota bacterium]MCD8508143.1 rod shape-determining protein [Candidatus Paceibacterota bacterium]MCD8527782.1 rod shape-determining protein [Candidatus Paceibacterota bacterium]MCD8563779.1 rod shape-determining protein [Candidatus Paceibacterota bacterium]